MFGLIRANRLDLRLRIRGLLESKVVSKRKLRKLQQFAIGRGRRVSPPKFADALQKGLRGECGNPLFYCALADPDRLNFKGNLHSPNLGGIDRVHCFVLSGPTPFAPIPSTQHREERVCVTLCV